MHERLPEASEEGKRKPTNQDAESSRVEKEWDAQVRCLPARVQATRRVCTDCDGRECQHTHQLRLRGLSGRRRKQAQNNPNDDREGYDRGNVQGNRSKGDHI